MSSIEASKREHLYKILVIGELGTGKTSFIKRYVHQFFSQNYRATIGVDFALKVLNWDQNTIIRLQLWDIAGEWECSIWFWNSVECSYLQWRRSRTIRQHDACVLQRGGGRIHCV